MCTCKSTEKGHIESPDDKSHGVPTLPLLYGAERTNLFVGDVEVPAVYDWFLLVQLVEMLLQQLIPCHSLRQRYQLLAGVRYV